MIRNLASLSFISAVFLIAQPSTATAAPVTIAWSPVGNAGNAADPATGSLYGAVGYDYNIGTYDVTNSQYVAFLNSNVPGGESADPLALYNSDMSDPTYGGINYNSAAANGSKYSVISGNGNNPVNFVTFYDTLRFANWLDNGQTPGSTETGAYTLLGGTPTPSNDTPGNPITRNAGATVFLPSENEWYKAAYYNPATSSYFQYPTSSNTVPNSTSPTSTPNSANFYPGGPDNLTAVGAYSGTTSPYGAYDMGGNVWQWNEALIGGSSWDLRGGSFGGNSVGLQSSTQYNFNPSGEYSVFGFRVASSAASLATLGSNVTASSSLAIGSVGGSQATFPTVTNAGTFTSNYQTATSQTALQTAIGSLAAGAINFGLVGQNANGDTTSGSALQFWDLHFDGTFTGSATVTLHYDPTLTGGVPSQDLQIYHYTGGIWVPVANEVVDPIADTITFTTDSFSPFMLGLAVPEPASIALLGMGAIGLAAAARRSRRAPPNARREDYKVVRKAIRAN